MLLFYFYMHYNRNRIDMYTYIRSDSDSAQFHYYGLNIVAIINVVSLFINMVVRNCTYNVTIESWREISEFEK